MLTLVLAAGCASTSGVISQGGGRYSLSRQGTVAGSSLEDLKNAALGDVDAWCRGTQQDFVLMRVEQNAPPYSDTNLPRVEVTFRCKPS